MSEEERSCEYPSIPRLAALFITLSYSKEVIRRLKFAYFERLKSGVY